VAKGNNIEANSARSLSPEQRYRAKRI